MEMHPKASPEDQLVVATGRYVPAVDSNILEGSVRPATLTADWDRRKLIYISRPASVLGGRLVTTEEIVASIPGWTAEEAIKRTGVVSRRWLGPDENIVRLAFQAVDRLLDALGNSIPTISLVLCSTTSPKDATPSIACQIATRIEKRVSFTSDFYAYDMNGACSGYLYGLRLACDHLCGSRDGAVLFVTAEGLAPMIDPTDPKTCFLFGDAATATLVAADPSSETRFTLHRPTCTALADPTLAIRSPCIGAPDFLRMDGIAVARIAYKAMANMLVKVATQLGIDVQNLANVFPHPGSQRILQNVRDFLKIDDEKIRHTLADTGNTCSSSIPVALDRFWDDLPAGRPIGFTAFGAGFTAAAAIGFKNED